MSVGVAIIIAFVLLVVMAGLSHLAFADME
jgi:hypothetical protein